MKKRLSLLLIAVLLLSSCASSSRPSAIKDDMRVESAPAPAPMMPEPYPDSPAAEEQGYPSDALPYEGAKIIRRLSYTLLTSNYDSDRAHIAQIVESLGGYEENASEYAYGEYGKELRTLSLVLRIPSDRFSAFQTQFESGRTIRNKQLSQEDVTLSYVDMETRIANLQARVTRYREMITEADTMADIIEIERALSEATFQLENYLSQKTGLDRQIDFSRVSIEMSEVADPLQVQAQDSFLLRLREGFVKGINSFLRGIQGIVIFLAANLLWILLILAGVLLVRLFSSKLLSRTSSRIRPRKSKEEEKQD